jgi:hypothetical protein
MTKMFSYDEMNSFLTEKGNDFLTSLRSKFHEATGFAALSVGFALDGDKLYFRFGLSDENLQKAKDAFKKLLPDHELIKALPDGEATKLESALPFFLNPRQVSPI